MGLEVFEGFLGSPHGESAAGAKQRPSSCVWLFSPILTPLVFEERGAGFYQEGVPVNWKPPGRQRTQRTVTIEMGPTSGQSI